MDAPGLFTLRQTIANAYNMANSIRDIKKTLLLVQSIWKPWPLLTVKALSHGRGVAMSIQQ